MPSHSETSQSKPVLVGPVVEHEQACVQCSYCLRGLPVAGVCPECGTPVQKSLRGILLEWAGRQYLATLYSGLTLIRWGVLVSLIVMIISISTIYMALLGDDPIIFEGPLRIVTSLMSFAGYLVTFVGYWRYTEPDPDFVGTTHPDAARRLARSAVVVQVVAAGAHVLLAILITLVPSSEISTTSLFLPKVSAFVGLCASLAWIVGFLGVMQYTRWLARRVPDPVAANRCSLYTWLLPVIAVAGVVVFLLGPLVALGLYIHLLDRVRMHVKSILISGVPAAA